MPTTIKEETIMKPDNKLTPEELERKIKKRRIKIGLLKIFMIALMIFIANIIIKTDVESHEKVHKIIFEDYGINATIELEGIGGYTIGMIPDNMSKEDYRFMMLAHEMNEIESYNSFSTKLLIIITIFLIVAMGLRDIE